MEMESAHQLHQQKPESTSAEDDVNSESERGLKELMPGNLDDCVGKIEWTVIVCPFSLSSLLDDVGDQLVRRRRRSDLEGDDLVESSSARRQHSRILSRWAARQAEELMTNVEKSNRETELIALAGLHTVSMLDSSLFKGNHNLQLQGDRGTVADQAPRVPLFCKRGGNWKTSMYTIELERESERDSCSRVLTLTQMILF